MSRSQGFQLLTMDWKFTQIPDIGYSATALQKFIKASLNNSYSNAPPQPSYKPCLWNEKSLGKLHNLIKV